MREGLQLCIRVQFPPCAGCAASARLRHRRMLNLKLLTNLDNFAPQGRHCVRITVKFTTGSLSCHVLKFASIGEGGWYTNPQIFFLKSVKFAVSAKANDALIKMKYGREQRTLRGLACQISH